MGLNLPKRTRRSPRQLQPDVVECIWPGDDAVDLAQSDLVTWCYECGQAGLVLLPDSKPDIIKIRPLGVRELTRVQRFMVESRYMYAFEAARHGIIRVGDIQLASAEKEGVRGLADQQLDALCGLEMKLPYLPAIDAMTVARGDEVDEDEDEDDDEDAKEDEFVGQISMPEILGYHILALTFRARRDDS